MLKTVEYLTTSISEIVWPVFLPIIIVMALYVFYRTIFVIKPLLKNESVKFKNCVGPISISLSAMVGCGATVGVLTSLNKATAIGQVYFEAMAFWAVVSAFVLVPLAYSETIVSKITNATPHTYLTQHIGKISGKIYLFTFIPLYTFAFAGIQFSGVDTAINVVNTEFFGWERTEHQRFLFVVVPMIIFVTGVIVTKLHRLFINTLAFLISVATLSYSAFFIVFLVLTSDYMPIFLERMVLGLTQPVNMLAGIPAAIIMGFQRIIQTAETGLGALGMASLEAKSKIREAGIISLIPAAVTVFVAILVTTYIASYGIYNGHFVFGAHVTAIERLTGFITTATAVTGTFGLLILLNFIVMSGLSTVLAAYYFLGKLTNFGHNTRIFIYFLFISTAGTLAIYGFAIIFDVLDLLMFVVIFMNTIGLVSFVSSGYKEHMKHGKIEG